MNILVNSRFNHVLNRYDNPTTKKEKFDGIEMDFAMKSIDLEDVQFSNFVKTKQNAQYKLLKEIYKDYKAGKNILERFEALDIEMYSKNTTRLSNILSYNTMQKFDNKRTSNVLKHHLKDEPNKMRLFIEEEIKDEKKILHVRLIDLFHLAIPSRHKGVSAEDMCRRTYNKHKNDRTSIGDIKKEI